MAVRSTPRPDRAPRIGELLLYFWRLSRPEAWMVSILPLYVGHLLATRELFPGFRLWIDFWNQAATSGATFADFVNTVETWFDVAGPFLLALIAMGPLIWAATLLINDVYDLAGDRRNPRKARSPLVQGFLSQGIAEGGAYFFGFLALLVAIFVNGQFFLLTFACLALAWLYSVPPVRLKTRPGADLAVNAIGIGFLAGLAGWSIARDWSQAPFHFFPQGLLVATAVYVPTTLVDYAADKKSGYLTLATHLGRRRAYLVGFSAWILCNVGALLLSWNDWVLPRRMLPMLVIFCPLLVYQYHVFIGKARTGVDMVRGVILCSLTFLAVNLVFALMYTGLWR